VKATNGQNAVAPFEPKDYRCITIGKRGKDQIVRKNPEEGKPAK
jgi:hypothetical protein